jgi:DNA polymerase (family 10)
MRDTSFTNKDLSDVFDAIADMMEILAEDRFRIRAYRRASEALQALQSPIGEYYARGRVDQVAGLSKGMAEKVNELFATGDIEYFSRLKERMPLGVRELLRVPHVGPRMAGRLYTELGIAGFADLQTALTNGQLLQIKGIGERTLAGIREGIAAVADREERTLLLHAWQLGERLLADIAAIAGVAQVTWSGSLRRGAPTIGDLDLVVASAHPHRVASAIAQHDLLLRSEISDTQLRAMLPNGMLLDVVVVDPDRWASTLLHTTGSRAHVAWLQAQAAQRGWLLDQHGLHVNGAVRCFATELEYYAALDMPWIAPELREWYVGAVATTTAPAALVTMADIQADLHMHTTWSDGHADIRTMAESARQQGYRYAAITDHGALMGITNGLNTRRLREQRHEIDLVNASYRAAGIDFVLLRGVEVDILVDGSLALPNSILHELDVVIASPHVNLRQTPEVATQRLLRAIAHPAVDIIGHPRGRILGGRLGAPVDMQQVIAAAVTHGVALEVNSGPDRLDIDGDIVREMMCAGGVISINSDAHAPENHAWMAQGVATARRGGAPPERVINTWEWPTLRAFIGGTQG